MAKKYRHTEVRKWNGDDSHSYAIFLKGQRKPSYCGLTRSEVPYYRDQVEKREDEKIAVEQKVTFPAIKMLRTEDTVVKRDMDKIVDWFRQNGNVWSSIEDIVSGTGVLRNSFQKAKASYSAVLEIQGEGRAKEFRVDPFYLEG